MAKQIIVPRVLPTQTTMIPIAGMAPPSVGTIWPNTDQYTHDADVQIIRSSSTWSAGLGETDCSILKAYEDLIANSEKFVFIENQFFVTSTQAGDAKNGAQNPIGSLSLPLSRKSCRASCSPCLN